MTQRLPIPGSDDGTWGDILNGFLEVSLNADGTIITSALTQAGGVTSVNTLTPSASGNVTLTPASLATGSPSSSTYLRGDGTWNTPNSGSSTLAADSDVAIVSPANNQVLTYNTGAGKWENIAPAVASVFGRTGAITATSGDYTAAQVTGALVNTNNLSDVADAGSSRANIHVPVLTPAAAVAVANVTLTAPGATIDGYSFTSGDLVLLTAQGTSSQNGLYIWTGASSTLTRPTEFATGSTIKGRTIEIQNGTVYGGTTWVLTTATAGIVIDTGSQVWTSPGALLKGANFTGELQAQLAPVNADDVVRLTDLVSFSAMLWGTSTPSNAAGQNGDLYFQVVTSTYYVKTSGTWTATYQIPGTIIESLSYNPSGANSYSTTSATYTAIDATNLVATITVPPSGQFWAEWNASNHTSVAGDSINGAFFIGGSQVGPAGIVNGGTTFAIRCGFKGLFTGQTPGASITIEPAWLVGGGATGTIGYGTSTSGPVNMIITAA